jgi:DNA invertase Pin-like site-specific DNA recombinase
MTTTTSPTVAPSKTSPAGSPTGGNDADATSPTLPETPLRAVAYIRESTEEQGEGFSPDAQRERIREFAPENDLELIGEYCDFHSGWRKSAARPQFQRLMADAAAGKFDVVLVFHTSRFARNQVEARRYKQMLREKLGIRVISVTQPMGEDHSDPSSFLAESIHEMFDEYYSVSLSFWVRSGMKEKARQGYLVGVLPWGYMRDPHSKLAVADPERAPLVQEMFERYATGQESDLMIAQWLNAAGARTGRNRPFSRDAVRTILCNTTYCGYIGAKRDTGRTQKGLHEPIVSEELFVRVQEVRGWRNRVLKGGPASPDYLLRKLLRCDRCGARTRLSRRPQPHATLHLLGAQLRDPLRRADRPSRALGVTDRAVGPRLSSRRETGRPDHKGRRSRSAQTRLVERQAHDADRSTGAPAGSLRARRPAEGAVRHAPPSDRGGAAAPRRSGRPGHRSRQGTARRLLHVLGAGDRARRASAVARLAVRAGVGAGRPDRCRAAT